MNERDARDWLGAGHLAPREREALQTLSETQQANYDPPAPEQMPWRKMASDSRQKLDTVITSADFEPKQQEGCHAKIAGMRPVVATEIT